MGKADESNVDPEVDASTTGETVDTTEAGAGPAEAPHHEAKDPGENVPDKDKA